MQMVLAGDFAVVREKYIDVIEHTRHMNIHARWIYGQHPTDAMIQSYIDRQEMYLFIDGQNVAGMTAITMYQGEDYHEVIWSQNLKDDEVASLHIFTVTPEYQGKGVSKRMMAEIISLAMCQTAHCGRCKLHFVFGEFTSPIVPYRNLPQAPDGMTADCCSLV